MPISNQWDNRQKTVHLIRPISPSTWEDVRTGFADAYDEIALVRHPVIIIFDATDDPNPPSPKVMTEMRNVLERAPENATALIVVGASTLGTNMLNALGRVLGKVRLSTAADRAEADERVAELLETR